MNPTQPGTVDPDALRRALRAFASGVTVVTSCDDAGVPVGMTVSAFASVSLSPPLVLVNLHRHSQTARTIAVRGIFAINILSEAQEAVSRRFAMRDVDRFQDTDWRLGVHGAPLIVGALAHLECSTFASVPGGDHDVVVGSVLAATQSTGRPLLYFDGGYQRLPEIL